VPTFLFIKGGAVVGRVEGADAPALADAAAAHLPKASGTAAAAPAAAPADEAARLQALLKAAPVMLFMKVKRTGAPVSSLPTRSHSIPFLISSLPLFQGTPDAPRCGFSRRVVGALQEAGVAFTSHDILSDPGAREGLKTLLDWPTFPMLVAGGELVGGCDIIEELAAAGELKSEVEGAIGGV